jgi:hypothetical protein
VPKSLWVEVGTALALLQACPFFVNLLESPRPVNPLIQEPPDDKSLHGRPGSATCIPSNPSSGTTRTASSAARSARSDGPTGSDFFVVNFAEKAISDWVLHTSLDLSTHH